MSQFQPVEGRDRGGKVTGHTSFEEQVQGVKAVQEKAMTPYLEVHRHPRMGRMKEGVSTWPGQDQHCELGLNIKLAANAMCLA